MAATASFPRAAGSGGHRSPPLGVLGIVFVALIVTSFVAMGIMSGGRFPTPYEPVELARKFYTRQADAVRVGAFFQFGAAIPLGLFTATVVSRLRFLGLNVAGVDIACFGGFASAIFLALSALTSWVLAQPGIASEPGALRALQLFGFVTGGPGHVVTLGLLLAGVSVPAAFARLVPPWLVWLGLTLAVLAELSTFSLLLPAASGLLPLARFPAFVWLIGVGFTMPKSRREHSARASAQGAETETTQ